MAELNLVPLDMAALDVKNSMKAQLVTLETLLAYLEDRGALGAEEYLYCQSALDEVVKQLKRLERMMR